MVSILEKLSVRLGVRQKQFTASWAKFVGDVADEKLTDADEILSGLERLGKSPANLQVAITLLLQRREWAGAVVAGDAAESDYPKLKQQAADAEQALKKLIDAHHTKFASLGDKIERARNAISAGAGARRELLETCSLESQMAATADVDSRIAETQAAKSNVAKRLRDCENWVLGVDSEGDKAASSDLERIVGMREKLAGLESELSGFNSKLATLQDERNAASASMLKPESI